MIRYPLLGKNTTIGVIAPSSGVAEEHHLLLEMALKSMEEKSFQCRYWKDAVDAR